MVASQARMQATPDEIVAEMAAGLRDSAETGDWERVEDISVRLRSAVMLVPEAQRQAALQVASESIAAVESLASTAKQEVTGRLSALRRGQDATRAYADTP